MRQQSKQRPNQQSEHMQGTVPVSRAANLFLMSALGLFGICVCILVTVIGTRESHRIQQTEQQKRVDLLGDGIEICVEDRLDVLYDQAQFSSIKQAVMQPKARKADITNFMSTLSILGTKPQMVLLDFEGAEIHRTQENPDKKFTDCPWVSQLIDGTQSQYAGILQLPGGPHWCIAVPVLYHEQPEGILAAVIPLQNMIESAHLSDITNGEELKILQKETVLARFGADNAAGPTQKTVLDRFKLTLQYTGGATQISATRNRILFTVIGLLFLMSLSFAQATAVLARKWFVKPLQQLRDATYSISHKSGKALFTEQRSRIREIALLSDDLKVLAKQVDDRESKLEELVEERTGELNTQKERLNNILEGTNVGTWEWNVQTGETTVNEKWANIIGYTLNEISPVSIDTWMKFAHPDDLKKSEEVLGKHFDGELVYYHFEGRMKHKDGHWIWTLDRGKVISRDDDGKPLWVSGTHQDITERKRAEEELGLTNYKLGERIKELNSLHGDLQQLRHAIEQSPVCVVITDLDGKIEYVNPYFVELTGYTQAEANGEKPNVLKSGKHTDEYYREIWETITSGRTWTGEFHNKKKDGTLYWENAIISPVRNEKGDIVRFVAVKEDITEKKAIWEELSLAKDTAEQATRSKSEFLANMSHEIRTPITAITGYADLLSDPAGRSVQDAKWAKQILRNAGHLSMLLDDILDLSRVEAGRLAVDHRLCDVREVVEDVADLLRQRAREKLLGFHVECAKAVPALIRTDATRLRQILVNFVSNAIKFTTQGSVSVDVTAVSSEDTPGEVHFSVRDTGIGIASANLDTVFDRFHRLDQGKKTVGGAGLGLAISKRLAELMKGRIEVTSTPDVGSCFTLILPLVGAAHDAADQSPGTTASTAPSPGDFERLKGLNLLLVEDNPDNAQIFLHMLEPLGIKLAIAGNGRAGLDAVVSHQHGNSAFDVILMDMQMPIMDGFAATREIRKRGNRTPIIALTAYAMESDKQRCLEAGCNAFIAKPVVRSELIGSILGVLNGDQPEDVAADNSAAVPGTEMASDPSFAPLRERYIESLKTYLQSITQAESCGDVGELQRLAHRLKGTAGNYGFPAVTAAAQTCDTDLRGGATLAEIGPSVERLKTAIRMAVHDSSTAG